ncbi:MAG: glycerol-3-phosphate 1-O-acyltransferase PlsY [Clostridia bacterium]|nr:glycerol-3-phosphate 1-O-acyltransferase PlsY [Clostridia bacterium]
MTDIVKYILVAVLAYLLGSVSVGIILSKLSHGPDLHTVGSGSTGASNVLRTMGLKYGLVTLFGDFAKALLACGIGWWIGGDLSYAMVAGLACIIGHNWPVFFHMEGGKGVAASCGVVLTTFPVAGVISILVCIAVIAVCRYISVGSMVLVTLFAILVSVFYSGGNWLIILWAIAIAALCIWRHHGNIQRLRQGTERKIGQKEKTE